MSDQNYDDVNSGRNSRQRGNGAGQASKKAKDAANKLAKGTKKRAIIAKIIAFAWPVICILILIILFIGFITAIMSIPGLMMDKINELAKGTWENIKSFFEGNGAYISEESQTELAEYIENMGYDVVGYGFASPEEVKIRVNDEDEEEITVKSKYLFSYLLADYNTYQIHKGVRDTVSKFWTALWGTGKTPLSGMLKFDDDRFADGTNVDINRENKTVSIKVWNPSGGGLFNKDVYTFNIDGWTGRYGKPLEFLLALHISTMAPDLAYHVASDKEFDTKVHISFDETDGNVRFQYIVNKSTIDEIKSGDFAGSVIWEMPRLEYLEEKIANDGTLTLSPEDIINIRNSLIMSSEVRDILDVIGLSNDELKDKMIEIQEKEESENDVTINIDGTDNTQTEESVTVIPIDEDNRENIKEMLEDSVLNYLADSDKFKNDGIHLTDEDYKVIYDRLYQTNSIVESSIVALGMSKSALIDAAQICEDNNGKGRRVLNQQPYITYVEKAWYKNIYFQINNSIRNSVTGDEWLKGASDFDAYELTASDEDKLYAVYDFEPGEDTDQSDIVSDKNKGKFQVLETRKTKVRTQKSQPLKGSTNARIKELFVGAGNDNVEGLNPKPEYYIYDGTRETAKLIDELKQKEESYRRSGNYTEAEVSEYINSIDENNLYREIDFNKNSLSALAILENMKTKDADFVLRDFKSLLVELKYFKASDLEDPDVGVLDWIIPSYRPSEWPNRRYEKQNYEYGTYIRSSMSMENLAEDESGTSVQIQTVNESGDGYSNTTKVNSVTYNNYKQTQGSYQNNEFLNGTMATAGATPTVAAIVASGYGFYEATPNKMAETMNSTTIEAVSSVLNDYGITSKVYTALPTQTDFVVNTIRTSLNQGKPVVVYIAETENGLRTKGIYSNYMVLLGEDKNGNLIMSNPGLSGSESSIDKNGLEEFVKDYMTENVSQTNRKYLILDSTPNGFYSADSGFTDGMDVITPGIGEITKITADSITIKFTEENIVKDMTMTIKGFDVDKSLLIGTLLSKEQVIGKTKDEDILVTLRAANKSIIENVEDYMPAPDRGSSIYYADLTEDEFDFFAAVLVAENGANEETMACVANVIKNRALDTEHFTDVNTIPEVLIASGQYGTVYKVPGSGPGPIPGKNNELSPPAGTRTYKIQGYGEYWVGNGGKPREATETSKQVAKEVLDGTIEDLASSWLGKLALYQVTLSAYTDKTDVPGLVNQHKLYVNGELYSHDWGSLVGMPTNDNCTL